MLPFMHDRMRRLEELVRASTAAFDAYLRSEPDADEAARRLLTDSAALYRSIDLAAEENELVAMHAALSTAMRGTNPRTLERVATRRREMERSVVYDVLTRSAGLLRQHVQQLGEHLDEARNSLVPIVLVAVHRQVIPPPAGVIDQAALDATWAAMANDPELRVALQQLSTRTGIPDLMILLAEIIDTLR